ncbi:TlpA disulfide reductase family protein [Fulvivirgaceae bacterium BMA12]|uniref:TlpA disulfide reductase family protein n=1 Tax=Agaribacillus aureus TaxID=3051825 RepID=A0ABT8LDW1_9BACT|nr:TlpA disulfide reductase family protein [Fulvivirgaceae bacterium BMA12]
MAKRLIVILFLAFFCFNTATAQKTVINGKLANIQNNKQVFLYSLFGTQAIKIDSATSNAGQFSFQYDNGLPRGFYKIGQSGDKSVVVILGQENLQFEGDVNQPMAIYFQHSKENELFQQFAKFNQKIQTANKKILQQAHVAKRSGGTQDELTLLQAKLDSLKNEQNSFYKKLSENNPDLFIGKVARLFISGENKTEEAYFSPEEFSDEEFTRGDMLLGKVYRYYQTFVPKNLPQWLSAADRLIGKTQPDSRHREVIYLALVSLFANGAPDNIWDIVDKYGLEYPHSKHYQYLINLLPPPAPRIGDLAPDITLPDQYGAMQRLSSLKGNYVLIDFWASWCGPCRKENPNVVKAYHKFQQYGFKVLGVSLDHNKEKWLAAIEKDQLNWGHISDLKGWKSEGASMYQVRSIPASFLVDPEGKIIAKNLRGQVLESTLEKLFIKELKN